MIHPSNITLTDLFAGCGGSSSGAIQVPGVHVQYAMNHWQLAIDSHNTNHPSTLHDCADISNTHPARYARTTGLIASPECTNHSLAKGKRRKNLNQQDIFQAKEFDPSVIRSRATMWDVVTFAEYHRYDFVITENVVDVRMWVMFDAWLQAMHSLGYLHECVYLNAMFAHDMSGNSFAPQSRDRIYIVFWKKGNKKPDLNIRPKAPCPRCQKVVEAVQVWKPGRNAGKYKTQYTYACSECMMKPRNMGGTLSKRGLDVQVTPFYFAALNALDLSLPMVRIGDRESLGKKPLSENTRKRIQFGLDKYGVRPTILDQANSSGMHPCRIRSVETDVINPQVCRNSSYLFAPYLFNMLHTQAQTPTTRNLSEAMPTQTTQESMGFVSPQPYLLANRDASPARALTDFMHTQTTAQQELLIVPPDSFMPIHHGKSMAHHITDPLATVSSMRTSSFVIAGRAHATPKDLVSQVLPTVTGRQNDLSLIIPIHGTARPLNAETEPSDTVMTTGHSSLILAPYHGTQNACQVTDPAFTVPTRDSIALIDTKPEIDDCYFRMLQPKETALAQGFPASYIILGNKSDQQKQIGNANPPPTVTILVQRCVDSLL